LRISRKFNRLKEVPEFAMFFVFNFQPSSQAECRRSDTVCARQALDVHGVELQTEDP
jgi:hypothetical protein